MPNRFKKSDIQFSPSRSSSRLICFFIFIFNNIFIYLFDLKFYKYHLYS